MTPLNSSLGKHLKSRARTCRMRLKKRSKALTYATAVPRTPDACRVTTRTPTQGRTLLSQLFLDRSRHANSKGQSTPILY